jgi:hypothetical protein
MDQKSNLMTKKSSRSCKLPVICSDNEVPFLMRSSNSDLLATICLRKSLPNSERLI